MAAIINKFKMLNDEHQALLTSGSAGIMFLDGGLRLRKHNDVLCRLLGHDSLEIGQPVEQILERLKDGPRLIEEWRLVLDDGQPRQMAASTAGGKHLDMLAAPLPDGAGPAKGLLVSVTDVTEPRKADGLWREARMFREVSAAFPAVIYQLLVDSQGNGRFVYAGENSRAVFGLGPEDLLDNPDRFKAMLAEGDLIRFRDAVLAAGQELKPFEFKFTIQGEGGDPRVIALRNSPSRQPDGSIMWNGLAMEDHGHQPMAATAIGESAGEDAGNGLWAKAGHDVHTLLGVVKDMARLSLSQKPGEEIRRNMATILDCAVSMENILDSTLTVQAGRACEPRSPGVDFDVREEVRKTLEPFAAASRNKGLEFSLCIDASVPEIVCGDPTGIALVLRCLLSNSVKLTDRGFIGVEVFAHGEAMPGVLEFSVRDTGDGISKDRQDRMFAIAAQQQADLDGTKPDMDLARCREMVEAMGGGIWLSSREGEGSLFSFTVSVEPGQARPERKIPQDRAGVAGLCGVRVLLAEDNMVNRLFISHLLETEGCRVDCAENGHEVLKALECEIFDVVLMDVKMPEMDGIEATRRIRGGELGPDLKDIPVVALTAAAMDGDREELLSLGMDDYLAKPVEPGDLLRTIKRFSRLADGEWTIDMDFLRQLGPSGSLDLLYANLVDNCQNWLLSLDAAAQDGDWPQVADIAHSMMGVTIPLRGSRLSDNARLLRQAAVGQDHQQARQALNEMKRSIRLVRDVFQEFLADKESRTGYPA
jgi:CheY-like chemotaxis protein/signal transduction histidine kinase